MFLVYVVAINKGSMRSILKQMITSKVSINNTVNLQIPIFMSESMRLFARVWSVWLQNLLLRLLKYSNHKLVKNNN